MANNTVVKIAGLDDLQAALAELPKATSRNVQLRVLKKRAETLRDAAKAIVPVRHGNLKKKIVVGTSAVGGTAGDTAFSEAMKAGATRAEAGAAARAANSADPDKGTVRLFVGPQGSARIYGHMVEFGTSKMAAKPFMRPAFDAWKDSALEGIKDELWSEISKAAARRAKRLAKAAGKAAE